VPVWRASAEAAFLATQAREVVRWAPKAKQQSL